MKIITTVGTSIFENCKNENPNKRSFISVYKELKNHSHSYNHLNMIEEEDIQDLKKGVKDWFEGKENASAEIKSILAIAAKEDNVEAHLIATDTVLSVFAAELIKEWFEEHSIVVHFNYKTNIVKDLRVDNSSNYRVGLSNLIDTLYNLLEGETESGYTKNCCLNITGGYKGIVPHMTIFGQVNKIDVVYIFEDTDNLLKVPPVPIEINNNVFNLHWEKLTQLEDEVLKKSEQYQLFENLGGCFDLDEDDFVFNALGEILWKRYKRTQFEFFASKSIYEKITSKEDIKNAVFNRSKLQNSLSETGKKIGPKLTHKTVYDDGNNATRIFFHIEDKEVYIYKVFGNGDYDEYDRYWRENDFTSIDYKKDSVKHRITLL